MNTLIKIGVTLVTLAFALIPFLGYLLARLLLSPVGFWQNLVLAGLGLWVLGFVQIILLVVWAGFNYFCWTDEHF